MRLSGFHSFEDAHEWRFGLFEVYETVDGWYWQACFPGCLPDGDAFGPFDTAKDAYDDAIDF